MNKSKQLVKSVVKSVKIQVGVRNQINLELKLECVEGVSTNMREVVYFAK